MLKRLGLLLLVLSLVAFTTGCSLFGSDDSSNGGGTAATTLSVESADINLPATTQAPSLNAPALAAVDFQTYFSAIVVDEANTEIPCSISINGKKVKVIFTLGSTGDKKAFLVIKHKLYGKSLYRRYLGRVPKSTEVSGSISVANVSVDATTTAQAIIMLQNTANLPTNPISTISIADAQANALPCEKAMNLLITTTDAKFTEVVSAVTSITKVIVAATQTQINTIFPTTAPDVTSVTNIFTQVVTVLKDNTIAANVTGVTSVNANSTTNDITTATTAVNNIVKTPVSVSSVKVAGQEVYNSTTGSAFKTLLSTDTTPAVSVTMNNPSNYPYPSTLSDMGMAVKVVRTTSTSSTTNYVVLNASKLKGSYSNYINFTNEFDEPQRPNNGNVITFNTKSNATVLGKAGSKYTVTFLEIVVDGMPVQSNELTGSFEIPTSAATVSSVKVDNQSVYDSTLTTQPNPTITNLKPAVAVALANVPSTVILSSTTKFSIAVKVTRTSSTGTTNHYVVLNDSTLPLAGTYTGATNWTSEFGTISVANNTISFATLDNPSIMGDRKSVV